ncbi:MAG: DUF2752 domain-containing protein [Planctomycetota bacterium]
MAFKRPVRFWKRHRIWWLSTLAVVAVPVAFALLRYAAPTPGSLYPKCALHQATGLHCPGCGATRAVHALAHFRMLEAIRFNPLLIIGLPLFLACLVWQGRLRKRGRASFPRFAKAVAAIVIAYFILRNVPTPQRSWLAPPSALAPPAALAPPSTAQPIADP